MANTHVHQFVIYWLNWCLFCFTKCPMTVLLQRHTDSPAEIISETMSSTYTSNPKAWRDVQCCVFVVHIVCLNNKEIDDCLWICCFSCLFNQMTLNDDRDLRWMYRKFIFKLFSNLVEYSIIFFRLYLRSFLLKSTKRHCTYSDWSWTKKQMILSQTQRIVLQDLKLLKFTGRIISWDHQNLWMVLLILRNSVVQQVGSESDSNHFNCIFSELKVEYATKNNKWCSGVLYSLDFFNSSISILRLYCTHAKKALKEEPRRTNTNFLFFLCER